MFKRQTTGSVVCSSCGRLVGVNDERCYHCGRRKPGLFGFAGALRKMGQDLGFVPFTLGACLFLFLVSLAMDPSGLMRGGLMSLLSPTPCTLFRLGSSGGLPVFEFGRWWTVLSATWLHGGLLHIAFNLYWVRQLGPAMAQAYGPGRAVIIYLFSSITGFLLTSASFWYFGRTFLGGASLTVGASASIFGWLGALIYYGRRSGRTEIGRQLLMGFVLPLLVLGLLIPFVDNLAHVGGLAGGWLLARWLDPLKPERTDHTIVALVLLVLSLLAVVVSYLTSMDPQLLEMLGCQP